MPTDNVIAAERDAYRKTANDLTDLIRDLEALATKFKTVAQLLEDEKADYGQLQAEAQQTYRDLGTLLQLAGRLAAPH